MAALWRDNYGFRVCGALWLVQRDPLEDRHDAPSSRWNLLVMCRRKMWSSPRAAGWITGCAVNPRSYQIYSFLWLAWDRNTTRPEKKRLRTDTKSLPSGPLYPCWMRGIVKRHSRHLGNRGSWSIWGVSWSQLQTQIVRERDFTKWSQNHTQTYAAKYYKLMQKKNLRTVRKLCLMQIIKLINTFEIADKIIGQNLVERFVFA